MGDFRTYSGFELDDTTMNKDESVTTKILKAFPNEKISLQHSVSSYQIDLYFFEHKLATDVDEKVHTDRNIDYEIKIQENNRKIS